MALTINIIMAYCAFVNKHFDKNFTPGGTAFLNSHHVVMLFIKAC